MASEIALIVFRRAKGASDIRDASSIAWLNIVIYGSLAISLTLAFSGYGIVDFHRGLLAWTGLFLILAGIVLRWWAILTLKRLFTVNVAIHQHHHLVKIGVYRLIRHPAYSGALLSFLGIAVSMSNWIILLFVVFPIAGAFSYRMRVEERALIDAFGAEYENYIRTTKRLIPWVY
jgi:protein-S-isoprenylcysteine O-methyltransferase Ste14